MVAFSDTITKAIYDGNPRVQRLKEVDFAQISYQRILDMYKERYADASDFIFTFVGNVNPDTLKPFIQQYLATLPSLKRVEKGNVKEVPVLRNSDFIPITLPALCKHRRHQLLISSAEICLLLWKTG